MPATQKVHVNLGNRSYCIYIQTDMFFNRVGGKLLAPFTAGKKVLVVADSNTGKLFAPLLKKNLPNMLLHTFPAGEKSKTFANVEKICQAAAKNKLDRSSMILALGGGVAGDMAGFAASIYMRGIDFIQVPTSLLAMVDSGIGGKTGVDLPVGKNLIGTFYQPKVVLIDSSFLHNLPPSELLCGYAELIKHAVLFDPRLFALIDENVEKLLALSDLELLSKLLSRSCQLKAAIVSKDEREGSVRALLNYGHTFGHAIEKLMNYNGILHGEAVALGMAIATTLSLKMRKITRQSATKQQALLDKFGLPTRLKGFKPEQIYQAMQNDKKSLNGKLRLIIPRRIGYAEIIEDLPKELVLEAIGAHCD